MPDLVAQVIRRTKGFYYLGDETGLEVECKAKGALFKDSKYDNQIAVGDRVFYQIEPEAKLGLITRIEPRKSFLSRNRVGIEAEQIIAANLDILFICVAAKDPEPRPGLIWRMLTAANRGNLRAVLILTKTDLIHGHTHIPTLKPFENLDLEILHSSKGGGRDDNRLVELLETHTSVLSGPSGVGKSSLINRLFPGKNIKVGEVGKHTGKGTHTTTYAQMYQIGKSGQLIDTPGIREFALWDTDRTALKDHFPLIRRYGGQCKHSDCTHSHEPHCKVKEEVALELLDPQLYQAYLDLLAGLERD